MADPHHAPKHQKVNDSAQRRERTQRTLTEFKQNIAQLRANRRHRERIRKLKAGEVSVEELDVIPFYRESDCDSYEQYEEIVGGMPGVTEFQRWLDER
jgi:hypothetical protein